jgi:hypothetical protein
VFALNLNQYIDRYSKLKNTERSVTVHNKQVADRKLGMEADEIVSDTQRKHWRHEMHARRKLESMYRRADGRIRDSEVLVVAKGREGLGCAGAEDQLVVEHGGGGADEWADPEYPVILPRLSLVVHNGRPQAPCRVDARAGDGDGGQVHHEHRESDGQRRQDRDVRIPDLALGVGGREHGVDEDEGAHDLGAQTGSLGVAGGELVGSAAVAKVPVGAVEGLDEAGAAHGAQALRDHVERGAHQRQLARQQQAEGDRRVNVAAGDAGDAVDEHEDHAAEGPGDAQHADAAARLGLGLALVPDDGGQRDVHEEQRGHELGDDGAVQGPLAQLAGVHEWCWDRVTVVLLAICGLYGLMASIHI